MSTTNNKNNCLNNRNVRIIFQELKKSNIDLSLLAKIRKSSKIKFSANLLKQLLDENYLIEDDVKKFICILKIASEISVLLIDKESE